MEDRIIRIREVEEITGLSASTIYRLEKEGTFPRRRKISDRASGWVLSEVMEWVQSRPHAA